MIKGMHDLFGDDGHIVQCHGGEVLERVEVDVPGGEHSPGFCRWHLERAGDWIEEWRCMAAVGAGYCVALGQGCMREERREAGCEAAAAVGEEDAVPCWLRFGIVDGIGRIPPLMMFVVVRIDIVGGRKREPDVDADSVVVAWVGVFHCDVAEG